MKRKTLIAASVLAAATLLAACGGSSSSSTTSSSTPSSSSSTPVADPFPSHDGIYATDKSIANAGAWDKAFGTATGLAGKKLAFTYKENVKVDVDAHGGTSDFSKFKVSVAAITTGYIDFSTTDFYAYVKTVYTDVNNESTNYIKEGLITKNADGTTYDMITTDDSEATSLTSVYAAYGSVFTMVDKVAATKATVLDSNAFIMTSDTNEWLYKVVGLSSTANNGVDDWEDAVNTFGTNANGDLVIKSEAPLIGYHTDQGVSDFGYSSKEPAAYVQAKVGADGYLTNWDVDYNGENASLDFAIMSPAPTVYVKGSRGFSADYNAAAQEHKSSIEHAEPEVTTKYATYSVAADTGVASFTVTRMVIAGQNPSGMADITYAGKDEIVDNLWFALKVKLADGATISSVKCNDADATLIAGYYCVKASEEKNYAFTVATDKAGTNAVAGLIKDAGVEAAVVQQLTVPNFTAITDVPAEGVEPSAMKYFVVKPTLASGKSVDKVLVNGEDVTATATQFGGYYGIKAASAGLYQFSIATK